MIRREYDRATAEEARIAKLRRSGHSKGMARSLDHLPEGKRAELALVTDLLRREFEAAVATRWSEQLKAGQIQRIVLYGSYARGDWVEDPVGRYFSDYDLLVVVADEPHTDVIEFWEGAERALLEELASGERLRTPVNFIVHSQGEVDDALSRGRPFFIDILNDGICLFEAEDAPECATPQPLTPSAELREALLHWEVESTAAASFLRSAGHAVNDQDWSLAAFLLHQTAEHLYNGLVLTLTLYTPKSHNLVRLRNLAERLHPELSQIWPIETKFQKRCFELLRQAYVKARYSPHYKVSPEELAWMRERIELLSDRVRGLCEAHLADLQRSASAAQ
jgi:predicted nucleotidyltransferase/HEPN domain-containing protein